MGSQRADIVFAGGGLASCLAALRISQEVPGCAVTIVEAGPQICGNHTWSYHDTDVSPRDLAWLQTLVAYRWAGQKVRFPQFERVLSTSYCSITSERLRQTVYGTTGIAVRENCSITSLDERQVTLASGERIEAPCVIDGRGFTHDDALSLGFQKFVGLEVVLASPHGETIPTIMDAKVEQRDGYRFVYVLPLAPDRLLIEDTRYSDDGRLDEGVVEQGARDYARDRGWTIEETVRIERGILPISLAHDAAMYWKQHETGAVPIGLRAGLFHPTTGYSLPECVNMANLIATQCMPLTTKNARRLVRDYAFQRHREHAFYRMLNRFLFSAALPDRRYVVLQRFYTLSQELIERFYAGKLTRADKIRILVGVPPVPIGRALLSVKEPSLR
jgi:lycopene beta-cyclase